MFQGLGLWDCDKRYQQNGRLGHSHATLTSAFVALFLGGEELHS